MAAVQFEHKSSNLIFNGIKEWACVLCEDIWHHIGKVLKSHMYKSETFALLCIDTTI